jgi:transcriptional regulator with XRE-family HTH domain
MAEDPSKRTCTALARALGVSRVAVSNWVHGKAKPDVLHRPGLRSITGIEAEAWEDAEERAAVKRRDELAARNPFATGTGG